MYRLALGLVVEPNFFNACLLSAACIFLGIKQFPEQPLKPSLFPFGNGPRYLITDCHYRHYASTFPLNRQ